MDNGHKDRLISLIPSCMSQIAEARTGAQMERQKQRERSLFQSSRPKEALAAADYAFFIMSLFLRCVSLFVRRPMEKIRISIRRFVC
jgi:hypothetical protein